jgi:hypothetical protein
MGSVHWLDALTQPVDQHLQRLAAVVKALLEVTAPCAEPQKGPIPSVVEEVQAVNRAEDDKRQKVDRVITDQGQAIQHTPDSGGGPLLSKKANEGGDSGSVVVRSSGAVLLIIGLVIVAAIAVIAVVSAALPSQEAITKCMTAGGSGGGCAGNTLLYGVVIVMSLQHGVARLGSGVGANSAAVAYARGLSEQFLSFAIKVPTLIPSLQNTRPKYLSLTSRYGFA